jgi:hypothetical protein
MNSNADAAQVFELGMERRKKKMEEREEKQAVTVCICMYGTGLACLTIQEEQKKRSPQNI